MNALDRCPRCHGYMGEYPALSRTDNRTHVCSACGLREGIEAMAGILTPQERWGAKYVAPEWGLRVPVDGDTELIAIIPVEEEDGNNYKRIREAIGGGYIENVRLAHDLTLYCDEEGKVHGLPFNWRATAIVNAIFKDVTGMPFPDALVGDVVFLGWDGTPVTRGLSDEWMTGFMRTGFWPGVSPDDVVTDQSDQAE